MGSSLFLRFYLGVSGSLSGGDVMDMALGAIAGFASAILIGLFLIWADEEECTKKFNVYACEKHVEWRPVQTQN